MRQLVVVAITDPSARIGTLEAAQAALQAGVRAIQVRWKDGSPRDTLELADALRRATRAAGALLLINDRVDIALAADADGAHLGDDDLPLPIARQITPSDFILGRSVDTPDEAAAAEVAGADYVGLGPIFNTASKSGLGDAIGPTGVAAVRDRVSLPIVAIGGIDRSRAAPVIEAGADGIAVIGAIMGALDPYSAARQLVEEVRRSLPESNAW
ncbi:MAG: thiamine phosphate synthase [Gemmatimonas sp.]|nr:thiamine phosphate synthase [Gemmatimonas sp.]